MLECESPGGWEWGWQCVDYASVPTSILLSQYAAMGCCCCYCCYHCYPLVQAGDVLILTKPLGVGVMTTALKKGLLPPEGYEEVRSKRDGCE